MKTVILTKRHLLSLVSLFLCCTFFTACVEEQPDYTKYEIPVMMESVVIEDSSVFMKARMEEVVELPAPVSKMPTFDDTKFNKATVEVFFDLSKATEGEMYFAGGPKDVASTMITILEKHARKGADIVFLIDNTGSMSDDISTIKNSMSKIVNTLKRYNHVHVSVATYGDMHADWPSWYERLDLTDDMDEVEAFIQKIALVDGGDFPESVYDAVGKTIDEVKWRSKSKRMLLILGDAPSLEKPKTFYSQKDIIKKCTEQNVLFNLYPVVISLEDVEMPAAGDEAAIAKATAVKVAAPVPEKTPPFVLTAKVYPNPARNYTTVEMNRSDVYDVDLLDLSGKVVKKKQFSGTKYELELADVAAGTYIVKVFAFEDYKIVKQKIVVSK